MNPRLAVYETATLPLSYPGKIVLKSRWSGGRELDPRPSPWEGDILPLNYRRLTKILNLF